MTAAPDRYVYPVDLAGFLCVPSEQGHDFRPRDREGYYLTCGRCLVQVGSDGQIVNDPRAQLLAHREYQVTHIHAFMIGSVWCTGCEEDIRSAKRCVNCDTGIPSPRLPGFVTEHCVACVDEAEVNSPSNAYGSRLTLVIALKDAAKDLAEDASNQKEEAYREGLRSVIVLVGQLRTLEQETI